MKRELTCIVCPIGCSLIAQVDDGKVIDVSGNTCPKGKLYAQDECTNPKRVVTSTVRCIDGSIVSVKTDQAIPKEHVKECMEILAKLSLKTPIHIGDILLKNLFGADLVATMNKE